MRPTLARGLGEVLRGFPQPEPGRHGDPGLFGPTSLAWKVNAESILLLGGGRALLMQVAHPLVAAGVIDHSDFTQQPFERLWRTVDSALTVIFGDTGQWKAAVRRVNAVHTRVQGARETEYSALDPNLMLWVHATLVDSSIEAYGRFVRPIPPAARERYYLEMRRMGSAFGIPDDLHPKTYAEFRAYLGGTIAALVVGEESRRIAREVLSPPAPLALVPARELAAMASVGLLPARLRSGLGLRWSRSAEAAFTAFAATTRGTLPLLPDRIRRWPHAREAERRMASDHAASRTLFRPRGATPRGPARAGSGASPRC